MKIVIITGSSIRHKAFANRAKMSEKLEVLKIFYEKGDVLLQELNNNKDNKLQLEHINSREQAEKDFFCWFIKYCNNKNISEEYIKRGHISEKSFLNKIELLDPDYIVVYGSSIIKGELINKFKNKILNVHLGLSPYYRGSGTNYFPFVNNEPEYCGASFIFLDEGIDTGKVIHQIRPVIYSNDTFHQLSNRFLIKVFDTYVSLIENFKSLKFKDQEISLRFKPKPKIYKRKDFTKDSLVKLLANFKDGMIQEYLNKKELRDSSVPIINNFEI